MIWMMQRSVNADYLIELMEFVNSVYIGRCSQVNIFV